MKTFNPTLDQIQPIFGREIAGNHTVRLTLDDGAVLCSCGVEIDGEEGTVWFIGHDADISDWDLISEADARALIADSKGRK